MTVSTAAFDPRALAAKLCGLHRAGKQAPTGEFTLPGNLREAMDVQNFLSTEEGIQNNAWKVVTAPDSQPVLAPLHPYVEALSGAAIPWMPGMKFEAEVAVRLGQNLPLRRGGKYSRADIANAIAEVHLGAEFLWSCIQEGGNVSFLLFLADRIGNQGYVLGPVLPKSIIDTSTGTPLKVTLNGRPIYDARAQHPKGDVLTWLIDYANDQQRPESSLRAGALVTTGTLCGAIELTSPGEIDILFDGTAKLHLSLVAK